ncbi:MAG: hypothetical protein IPJ88_14270 [Myxococcales bacterium]|nr:MAG: hypothetical protein IPJ88_14270 [Myxococcales bacterium]
MVPFRVRLDNAGLNNTVPSVKFVVEALPGSRAQVDRSVVDLDARGKGFRVYSLADVVEGSNAFFEKKFDYRVAPPNGKAIDGMLRARIPRTALHIELPRDEAITDEDHVEVVGAVHPNATLRINEQDVSSVDGYFGVNVPLETIGDHDIEILAHAREQLPHHIVRHVRRVKDYEDEAAHFSADPRVTYHAIAKHPELFEEQNIRIVGKVYNVGVHEGHGVLQMLARECDRHERCPFWVALPTSAEAKVGDWVQVLGVFRGEQQFRSQSGEITSVPRIDAAFVLPAEGK